MAAWHRHLDVKGNLNLINLNLFQLTKNKKGIRILKFCKGNKKMGFIDKATTTRQAFCTKKSKMNSCRK